MSGAKDIKIEWDVTAPTAGELASVIDHTLLKASARRSEIIRLCEEAKTYRFASVCVNSRWVPVAAAELADSPVAVCTVVGFPLGASAPAVKAVEASHAVYQGASEVDMVIDIGALKDGDIAAVEYDIENVAVAARDAGRKTGCNVLVKVIIETCCLSDREKEAACHAAKNAGADFVKTSTGFGTGGATAADVALMRRIAGDSMGVKASGGIRDYKTAIEMLKAGANRLGVSAGIAIVRGAGGMDGTV